MNITNTPLISFGLPVRNGGLGLERTLKSLQTQDTGDIEIVISDNASSDDTQNIIERAAKQDPRIIYHRHRVDAGQIANFNKVFELARGKYFRWIGCGDYLTTDYGRRCAQALDAHPEAIGVTTDFSFESPDGSKRSAAYHGPRLESSSRLRRLQRFLWLTEACNEPLYFDPIYSMIRSDALRQTNLLQVHRDPDHILALELCLAGPFVHVPKYLAVRGVPDKAPYAIVAKRYHQSLEHSRMRMTHRYIALAKVAADHADSAGEKVIGYGCVLFYYLWRARNPLRRYRNTIQRALFTRAR